MNCKYCETPVSNENNSRGMKKMFCDDACYRAFLKQVGPNELAARAIEERRNLFAKARSGNTLAKLELRLRYGITAVWNGEALTPI